ncbi:MAG: hypothetical protein ABEJ23_06930 [Haloarculaceae archaeon]
MCHHIELDVADLERAREREAEPELDAAEDEADEEREPPVAPADD